jgi:hydrogenase-4 component F
MNVIRGVIDAMPFIGILLVLGVFALGGSPPFSIFMSEIMIMMAGFKGRFYIQTFIFLAFAVIIFAALMFRFGRVLFGRKPEGMSQFKESLSIKVSFLFLFGFIFVLGFIMPGPLNRILTLSVEILKGN